LERVLERARDDDGVRSDTEVPFRGRVARDARERPTMERCQGCGPVLLRNELGLEAGDLVLAGEDGLRVVLGLVAGPAEMVRDEKTSPPRGEGRVCEAPPRSATHRPFWFPTSS